MEIRLGRGWRCVVVTFDFLARAVRWCGRGMRGLGHQGTGERSAGAEVEEHHKQ